MERKAQTSQHNITVVTSKATTVKLKVLEATLVDERLHREDWSGAACACGSGGGCSGGNRRHIAM